MYKITMLLAVSMFLVSLSGCISRRSGGNVKMDIVKKEQQPARLGGYTIIEVIPPVKESK